MKPGRNDPCPCESGKKYKHCCEVKAGPMSHHKSLILVAGVLVIASGVWIGKAFFSSDAGQGSFLRAPGPAPPGKGWSPEHGHYHDASPGQPLPGLGQAGTPQPQGAAPPGKVWSAEHGHYHDASPGQPLPGLGQAGTPQPQGAAPPGKVWSAEHGHYHDAPPDQSPADSGQTDTLQAAGPAPR